MKIAFLGLVKDCEHYLPQFFDILDDLKTQGYTCVAILGEDGSTDHSKDLILQRQEKFSDTIYIDTSEIQRERRRLRRMALGRDLTAAWLKECNQIFDFVVVVDMDNALNGLNASGILRCVDDLAVSNDLFGVSGNSRPYYYDILALKSDLFSFNTAAIFYSNSIVPKWLSYLLYYFLVRKTAFSITRCNSTITVESAFNGFCVYKWDKFCLGQYSSNSAFDQCEHITLNCQISQLTGQRIKISQNVFISTPVEHYPTVLHRIQVFFNSLLRYIGTKVS